MNIIARAALYLYDGSAAAPIFPDKVGKPGDEAAAYLSTVADKLMASDGSRTTCVEPSSAQEEMLRRFSTGLVDGVINLLPQIRPEEAQQLCGSVPVVTNIREQPVPVWLDYDKLTRDILSFFRDRSVRRRIKAYSTFASLDRGVNVGASKRKLGSRVKLTAFSG